jgi:hypothetical protein
MGNTGRRGFLIGTGLAGVGAVLGGAPAVAENSRQEGRDGYLWLAGDHHIHTQYSNDAMYPVATQVQRAAASGLSWMTITDHGNVPFATYSVPPLVADIAAARRRHGDDVLVAARAGDVVEVVIKIDLADRANFAGLVPKLARVDLILGRITGPAADRSVFHAPQTKVAKSWDIRESTGTVELVHRITVDGPFYLRVRGTDGKRGAPGYHGCTVDPAGPALDVVGQADPWEDLWFYSNPIFATVA